MSLLHLQSLHQAPLNVTRRYERDSYAFLRKKKIFCSESSKWTKAVASSPRSFCVNRLLCDAVAHNGMLYWWGTDFIIGFNPYSNDTSSTTTDVDRHIYCCRFIGKPVEEFAGSLASLNVCRGCLRISQRFCYTNPVGRIVLGVSIKEFKDDGDQVDSGRWCLLDRFYIRQIIAKDLLISKWYHGRYWEKCTMRSSKRTDVPLLGSSIVVPMNVFGGTTSLLVGMVRKLEVVVWAYGYCVLD
ncbi:unnamed protein product [Prunus armeniaca]